MCRNVKPSVFFSRTSVETCGCAFASANPHACLWSQDWPNAHCKQTKCHVFSHKTGSKKTCSIAWVFHMFALSLFILVEALWAVFLPVQQCRLCWVCGDVVRSSYIWIGDGGSTEFEGGKQESAQWFLWGRYISFHSQCPPAEEVAVDLSECVRATRYTELFQHAVQHICRGIIFQVLYAHYLMFSWTMTVMESQWCWGIVSRKGGVAFPMWLFFTSAVVFWCSIEVVYQHYIRCTCFCAQSLQSHLEITCV